MGRCRQILWHHPRQRRRITFAVEQVLLARAITRLSGTVGIVELLLTARVVRCRALRVIGHALTQLLFELAFLQLIARLLLLRSLLELQARRLRG
ncbi:hypothetical protein GCM10008098_08620 [Rhodanobacter panaciterrae]|uniref:Uncharacterized protein n=1 Tax=Rhodanobacter panaciterrae TaxID=490572 RepID=A0ABQ2ZP23_9GAMM|nr:hypothetical protein GCM10008098_08620 [Rhodanobacter panaciterrae]